MPQAYEQLEETWGRQPCVGGRHVVACSSGTAALHLALESLQLPPGSSVIVPDFAMIAVPRAVVLAGLRPVFVDVNEVGNIDPDILSRDTIAKAVVVIHTYGRKAPVNSVAEFCLTKGLALVEDLAEAHGVKPHHYTAAACWSFYRNKIVAGEEGGAVAFKTERRAILARQLRCLGFTEAHDFNHVPRGHNYRLANALASLIIPQMTEPTFANNLKLREGVANAYDAHCPAEWRMPKRTVNWVYDFRIPGLTAGKQDEIVRTLRAAGVEARHAFKPCSFQEEFRGCPLVKGKEHVAERLSREVIYFPLSPYSTPAAINAIASTTFGVVRKILAAG